MIDRILKSEVLASAKEYPIVTIVGPRQSGKTTLAKLAFPKKAYYSLENPDTRAYAVEDPRGFLADIPEGAILDEIQRTPDLLSYLQENVDNDSRVGRFILTGSQHFLLMQNISQSLAGRTAILTLLPLSFEELPEKSKRMDLDDMLRYSFYPRVHSQKMNPYNVMRDYFQTYVERDIRNLLRVHDLMAFESFVRLSASFSANFVFPDRAPPRTRWVLKFSEFVYIEISLFNF